MFEGMRPLVCEGDNHVFIWEGVSHSPTGCPPGTPCLCGKTFWGQEVPTTKADLTLDKLDAIMGELRARKGGERSTVARHLAVVITELEKAYAYYLVFCSTEML